MKVVDLVAAAEESKIERSNYFWKSKYGVRRGVNNPHCVLDVFVNDKCPVSYTRIGREINGVQVEMMSNINYARFVNDGFVCARSVWCCDSCDGIIGRVCLSSSHRSLPTPCYNLDMFYIDDENLRLFRCLLGSLWHVGEIVVGYLGKVHTMIVMKSLFYEENRNSELSFALSVDIREVGPKVRIQYKRPAARVALMTSLLDPLVLSHKRQELAGMACARVFRGMISKTLRSLRGPRGKSLIFANAFNRVVRRNMELDWIGHQMLHIQYHRDWVFLRDIFERPSEVARKITEKEIIYQLMLKWEMVGKYSRARFLRHLSDDIITQRPQMTKNSFCTWKDSVVANPVTWFQVQHGIFPAYMSCVSVCVGGICPSVDEQGAMLTWSRTGKEFSPTMALCVAVGEFPVDRRSIDDPDESDTTEDDVIRGPTADDDSIMNNLDGEDEKTERDARADQEQPVDAWEVEEGDYGVLAQSQTMPVPLPQDDRHPHDVVDLTGDETEPDENIPPATTETKHAWTERQAREDLATLMCREETDDDDRARERERFFIERMTDKQAMLVHLATIMPEPPVCSVRKQRKRIV